MTAAQPIAGVVAALCALTGLAATSVFDRTGETPTEAAARPEPCSSTVMQRNPFARFDFRGGTRYPARPLVSMSDTVVEPGQPIAVVVIRLDRPAPTTVLLRVRTRNGSGFVRGIEGRDFEAIDRFVVFRPGDPLEQSLRIRLLEMAAGRHFEVIVPEAPVGAKIADGKASIVSRDGAPAQEKSETGAFRRPQCFEARGEPVYDMDPGAVRYAPGGGRDIWATDLAHGRTQPANGETGLYLDESLHPAADPPIATVGESLVLHSQKLARPIQYGGETWRHGAAVLSGRMLESTHVRYGQYEWVAQMPDRRGSWPALWLRGARSWPPEIDVFEAFGDSPDWDFARDVSANIHGGPSGRRTFERPMRIDAVGAFGAEPVAGRYHRFAVDIGRTYITWFLDGREVYQAVNPFHEQNWYPLMTVAVKKEAGPYEGGSGDMRIRSFRVWRDK